MLAVSPRAGGAAGSKKTRQMRPSKAETQVNSAYYGQDSLSRKESYAKNRPRILVSQLESKSQAWKRESLHARYHLLVAFSVSLTRRSCCEDSMFDYYRVELQDSIIREFMQAATELFGKRCLLQFEDGCHL
eukprot:4739574-Amphidinium_carterae.1